MKNPEKLLLAALAGQKLPRPPIWLMRQAGRYLPEYRAVRSQAGSFLDLCYRPDLAAEVTFQPIRRFGFDAAILFADILLISDALGQKLDYREGEGPVLEPVRDLAGLKRLGRGDLHGHLAPVYETVARLREGLPASCTLIGFAGAPWTVATYMVEGGGSKDHARTKHWAFADPAGFQQLIDLLVEATIGYLLRQVEAGADALQLFDTWSGALPAAEFDRWCAVPMAAIVRGVRAKYPAVPIIAFPRGAGVRYDGFAAATGVDGVSLDSGIPLAWARDVLQKQTLVQGNLDPQLLVVGGRPMLDAADAILEAFANGPHIFNLGHGIVPETPPDHVAALVNHVQSWRKA